MQALQAILMVTAIVAVAAIAWAVVTLVRGVLSELNRLTKTIDEEIVPVIRDARTTVNDTDRLIASAAETVRRVDRLTGGAEGLIDGSVAGLAANKTVQSASVQVLSVYEGIRRGIRFLRGSSDEVQDKGGTTDEQ